MKILNARLIEVVEKHILLGEIQKKFRKGRSTADCCFVLNTILWKSIALRKLANIAFLDIQKAYDSVNRGILWTTLLESGFGGKFLECLEIV